MKPHPNFQTRTIRRWLTTLALAVVVPAYGQPDPFAGELEYYVDVDPGEGLGTPVAVTGGTAEFTVATGTLAPGTHTAYFRARLPGGEWGPRFPLQFSVEGTGATETVTAIEYAWDGAAATGGWTTVPLGQPATRAEVPLTPILSGLKFGTHTLHLRGIDASGTPGIAQPYAVSIVPGSLTGHPPLAGRVLLYLQRAGAPIADTYAESPLASGQSMHALLVPLGGIPVGDAQVMVSVGAVSGQPGPELEIPFTVVENGSNGYADWSTASGHFSVEELAIPSISGALADPDLDGLANVAEFAFGTDPKSASPLRLPQLWFAGDQLRLKFRQVAGGTGSRTYGYTANGISYRFEVSHDPGTDVWMPAGGEYFTVTGIQDNGDGTEDVEVTVASAAIDNAPTLIRVRIVPL